MIVLAPTNKDFELARKKFHEDDIEIYLTGAGPQNILRFMSGGVMKRTRENILLFGYVRGGNALWPETQVYVSRSLWYAPSGGLFENSGISLEKPPLNDAPKFSAPCYTAIDLNSVHPSADHAIYDSELAFLATLYPQISAWRIVR